VRQLFLAAPARFDEVPGKVSLDSSSHSSGCLISWFAGHDEF
jgi:hypothetical protein